MTQELICTVPVTDILETPQNRAEIRKGESQLLFGESFVTEKEDKNYFHGISSHDGYKGWVRKECLAPQKNKATHFVAALSALVYPEASAMARPILNLSFLSRLIIEDGSRKSGFLWCAGTGWVPEQHVSPLSELGPHNDVVDTAMRFIHAPYRYGGRLAWGLDCSALVQLALNHAGYSAPRDSHEQQEQTGQDIYRKDRQRGDLVFFPGHVGIMLSEDTVINATTRKMSVVLETLEELEEIYGAALCFKRVPAYGSI